MPADRPLGLRERKKIQTRAAIRREAFRLIEQQGFQNTTVEQIAEAAEVSPSTFFRYFPTKEAVLLSNEQMQPIVDAFVDAPSHLRPVAAYRHAVGRVFGALSPGEREDAAVGQRLMYAVPEARGLLYTEYVRLIGMVTDALGRRMGRSVDECHRRVIAGAIVGVLIAASDDRPMPDDPIMRFLEVLETVIDTDAIEQSRAAE
jgi:AcrR family transcriptional regulator